jgi:serine acetyltransferase
MNPSVAAPLPPDRMDIPPCSRVAGVPARMVRSVKYEIATGKQNTQADAS